MIHIPMSAPPKIDLQAMTTSSADLTDAEIDSICAGLRQNHAKAKYLERLGLRVHRRPNGRPLVSRADWERLFSSTTQSAPANAPRWKVA